MAKDYDKLIAAEQKKIDSLKRQRSDINKRIKKCESVIKSYQSEMVIATAEERGVSLERLLTAVEHLQGEDNNQPGEDYNQPYGQ